MRWPHFHGDPDWKVYGVHAYYECSCGARRVRRAYSNLDGPVANGWPNLLNRHGELVNDTGWVRDE